MKRIATSLCLALALILPGTPPKASADTVDIPIELGSDSFHLYQVLNDGTWVEKSFTIQGFNSPTSLRFLTDTLDPLEGPQVYLQDASTGYGEYKDISNLSVMFDMQTLTGGLGPSFSFAIPEDLYGHAFAIEVTGNGIGSSYYFIVSTGAPVGGYVDDGTGIWGWQNFGFFNGRAIAGLVESPLWNVTLIDLTAKAATNGTNALGAQWGSYSNFPIASITVYFPDNSGSYTLVTSSGSLQSLSPVWDAGLGVYVSNVAGQVPWGDSFYFCRDVDGATSATFWSPGDLTADTRTSLQPYVNRNLNTHSFEIGNERLDHQIAIIHADGFKTYLTLGSLNSGVFYYYDDNGLQNSYFYSSYVGQIDDYQSAWYLKDETTGEELGQNYQVFTAFEPLHHTEPGWMSLYIPLSRAAMHPLRLLQQNGEQWNVQPGYGSSSMWTYVNQGTPWERWYEIQYRFTQAPYTPSDSYSVLDTVSGDNSGSFTYSGGIVDLTQWYLPTQTLGLRINHSRWFNALFLVQPNTQEPITKGNLQGSWEFQNGQVVFNSGGFYDATAPAHPDVSFWLWDATRQEYLTPDEPGSSDFINAYDGTDTDGDGLPDWWEHMHQLNHTGIDTDYDGLSDYDEYMQGTNPLKKDNSLVPLSVTAFSRP
jgi:hypothetical protein